MAWRLHLLGPLRWTGTDSREVKVHSAKLAALLGLNHPRPVSRKAAAALLWPDTSPPQALSNLRAAASRLSGDLPPRALEATSERLSFNPQVVETDLADLRQEMQDWSRGDDGPADGASLTALLSQEALEGWEEEWAIEFQASWRLEAAQLLALAALRLESEGRAEEAISACRAGLSHNPLQEDLLVLLRRLQRQGRERRIGLPPSRSQALDRALGSLLVRLLETDREGAQEVLSTKPFREEIARHPRLYLDVLLEATKDSSLESLAAQRCLARAGLAASILKKPKLAVELGERVLASATHLPLRKTTLLVLSFDYWILGQKEKAWESVDRARDACRELGDLHDEACAVAQKGTLLLMDDRPLEAEPLFRESLRWLLSEAPEKAGRDAVIVLGNLGQTLLRLGRNEEAWQLLIEAEARGRLLEDAETHRVYGASLAWLALDREGTVAGCRRMEKALRAVGRRLDRGGPEALGWAELFFQRLGRDEDAEAAANLRAKAVRREADWRWPFPVELRPSLRAMSPSGPSTREALLRDLGDLCLALLEEADSHAP